MATRGSDCPTGKRQFATKKDAEDAARQLRTRGSFAHAFRDRCGYCDCWHVGNPRARNSKGRRRNL